MGRPPLGRSEFFGYLFLILNLFFIAGTACSTDQGSLNQGHDQTVGPNVEATSPLQSAPEKPSSDPLEVNAAKLPENRIFGGNLRYFVPPDWDQALVISSFPDPSSSISSPPIEDLYISWSIVRDGEFLLTTEFFVDLYLDGTFLERWKVDALNPGIPKIMSGWSELLYRTNLSAGEHQLELVIDSTDLILEDDEEDNIILMNFSVPKDSSSIVEPTIALDRLPNLIPFTPPGWDNPIRVRNNQGASNGFEIGEDLEIQVAFKNSGLSSVDRNFLAYLYLDEIPVAKFSERNLIADEAIVTSEWSGLDTVLRIAPGQHTFTLVVDPTQLIQETKETDNIFTRTVTWGQNMEIPNEAALIPSQINSGSIGPFVPPGWDSPLIVTSVPGSFISSYALNSLDPAFVHWAMVNRGDLPYETPYEIELHLDGRMINSWNRTRLESNETDIVFDWVLVPPLDVYSTSKLELFGRLLDDSGKPKEVLLATKLIRWSAGPQSIETSTLGLGRLSPTEQLVSLEALLSTNKSLISHIGLVNNRAILDLADSVYYEIYSKRLSSEEVKIHLLSESEYSLWISIECKDRGSYIAEEAREEYIDQCHRIDEFGGFFTYWRNHFHVVIQAERPPMKVFETLAHELGHFRQSLTNPQINSTNQSLNVLAFREAQAYSHQVLFVRTLGELVGRDLLSYPKLDGYEWFIDHGIDQLMDGADSNEHDRGRLLLWLSVLTDPKLGNARNALLLNKYLTPEAAKEVFLYLLSFRPSMISPYVAEQMEANKTYESVILEIGNSRLSFGVSYWNEGSPYLRETGLLLP